MKIFSMIIIFLVVFAINTFAGGLENLDEARRITDTAMESVRKGEIYNMFEGLKSNWPLSVAEIDVARDKSINQRKMVDSRFGKSIGVKYIDTEVVGDTVAKILYIEKFERHIIRWEFIFYKPENKWFLNTFVWDDQIKKLFK